jgi:hypothetical protein
VVEQAPLHKKAEPVTKIESGTVGFQIMDYPTQVVGVVAAAHRVVQTGLMTVATAAAVS